MKEPITQNELTEEIATILGDELVAAFKQSGNEIHISFPSGKKFVISVREQ